MEFSKRNLLSKTYLKEHTLSRVCKLWQLAKLELEKGQMLLKYTHNLSILLWILVIHTSDLQLLSGF